LYVLSQSYNVFECANKIKTPSYVSLETVLAQENIIFQDYGPNIYSISNNTFSKKVDSRTYIYKKISNRIFMNPLGILNKGTFSIATKERAICDRLYLSPGYHFDTIASIDRELLKKISFLYNKKVERLVAKLLD
jgi:hypothetical protein